MMLYICKLKHFAEGNSNEQKEIWEQKHKNILNWM